jgi:hypothetical protein
MKNNGGRVYEVAHASSLESRGSARRAEAGLLVKQPPILADRWEEGREAWERNSCVRACSAPNIMTLSRANRTGIFSGCTCRDPPNPTRHSLSKANQLSRSQKLGTHISIREAMDAKDRAA